MKAIYKLHFDCGRSGSLEGLFVADTDEVKILIEEGIEVYFGEVLGKHSEVYGPIEANDIEMVSDSEGAVIVVETLNLSSGHNPFDYTAINFDKFEHDDMTVGEICKKLLDDNTN